MRVCVCAHYLVNAELPRHRGLDVPSGLGGQVHHHRAVLHALHHGRGDEDGGLPAWRGRRTATQNRSENEQLDKTHPAYSAAVHTHTQPETDFDNLIQFVK